MEGASVTPLGERSAGEVVWVAPRRLLIAAIGPIAVAAPERGQRRVALSGRSTDGAAGHCVSHPTSSPAMGKVAGGSQPAEPSWRALRRCDGEGGLGHLGIQRLARRDNRRRDLGGSTERPGGMTRTVVSDMFSRNKTWREIDLPRRRRATQRWLGARQVARRGERLGARARPGHCAAGAASCSAVAGSTAAMISSASAAPSPARSGVAWMRTTTSSPSISCSRT